MQTVAQLQSGALSGSTSLRLSEGLTHFPEEIFSLADTLEILDLSGNSISELPADFGRLKKLRILFCSDNPFTTLPEVLADCPLLDIVGFKANIIGTIPPRALNPNIRWLILTNNRIAELPKEIGNCPRMQKLMLAGNRLTTLPPELAKCSNLGLLRISANRLAELPAWLLSMPRLAWLACSDNPFSLQPQIAPLPVINWYDLNIHNVLGEGASGIIYNGVIGYGTARKDVAVKLFKGDVTSDGLPTDEMNTFIAAGAHPGMVKLIGSITGHPSGKQGLVMELIPDRYYNLGKPPSFESCTRDVFTAGSSLSAHQVVKIVTTIASVAAQLHNHGIMHGDLYAHNTLIDDEGNTLFGDFGAASFYDSANTDTASLLQRIEVRAFGYLLDDLLYLSKEQAASTAITRLKELRDKCLSPQVASRPGFAYLQSELQQL